MSGFNNSASGEHELLTATFTGEHETDVDNLFENSETVEWEFDERALFQTVAFRIYQSDKAGVREPLLNGVSSSLRAKRLFDVSPKVGVYLYEGDEDTPMTLIIRDNGVGIDEDTLRNGLAYVGKSQNRWVADLVGKFGVGFLASFRLVSETGTFFMQTRDRTNDEEFRGRWSSRGFEIDRGDDLPDVFGENEYGTRLEFPLKDDISRKQIRAWVTEQAENARVPVEYREQGFDETGVRDSRHWQFDPENKNEIYGGETLREQYSDTAPVLTIEEDDFIAHCSPAASNTVLCLDSPVAANQLRQRRGPQPPFKLDIRLRSENGPVIEGPHEGLTPVSESELNEIPTEFHDQFVLKSKLTGSDVQLPHPTGTRENLSDDTSDFFPHLIKRFKSMYDEQMQEILNTIDTLSDVYDLDDHDRFLLFNMVDGSGTHIGRQSLDEWVESNFSVELDDETLEAIELLATSIEVLDETDGSLSDADRTRCKLFELAERVPDESTVFVGASLHPTKAKVAWAANDENRVVQLPSESRYGRVSSVTEMYDIVDDAFGWKPLKSINKSTVGDYNVSDDLKDALRNGVRNTGDGVEDRTLTLHLDNREQTWKVSVSELVEFMQAYHSDDETLDEDALRLTWNYAKPTRVILFPSTSDANVSDHYDLSTKTTAVAYCTKKTAEHLEGVPGVVQFSEMENDAQEVTVLTSDGTTTVDGTPNKPIVHIVPDEYYDVFAADDVMEAAAEYIPSVNKRSFRPEDWSWQDDDDEIVDATYIPITPEQFEQVSPALPNNAYLCVASDRDLTTRDNTDGIHNINNTRLYAYAKLPEWRDTSTFRNIMQGAAHFSTGGKEMVDALVASHDTGFELDGDADEEE